MMVFNSPDSIINNIQKADNNLARSYTILPGGAKQQQRERLCVNQIGAGLKLVRDR
jgi:hypothetical protein